MIKNKGFTLIEIMIAMTILGSGIFLVVETRSGSYAHLRRGRLMNNVATLLEKKMTELEVLYTGIPLDKIPEETKGTFEGYPDYTWEFKSKKYEFPDLTFFVKAQGKGINDTQALLVSKVKEFVDASVKEGTLIIKVNYNGKKLEYTLTTYFVDYNQQLSVGGMGGG